MDENNFFREGYRGFARLDVTQHPAFCDEKLLTSPGDEIMVNGNN